LLALVGDFFVATFFGGMSLVDVVVAVVAAIVLVVAAIVLVVVMVLVVDLVAGDSAVTKFCAIGSSIQFFGWRCQEQRSRSADVSDQVRAITCVASHTDTALAADNKDSHNGRMYSSC
jgi:hypothetical protein